MIGVLITARLGSTRLKKKHLRISNGKTFLEWLILRFQFALRTELESGNVKLILATSDNKENKEFESYIQGYPIQIFYGSDKNIPLRYCQCIDKYKFQYIIIVDGDDILCSTEAAAKIIEKIKSDSTASADIIKVEGLPLGMNLTAYKSSFMVTSLAQSNFSDLEVGWARIFCNPNLQIIKMGDYKLEGDYRFTLDYEEDALFFDSIIAILKDKLYSISDNELLETVEKNRLYELNKHLSEEYWNNYFNAVKKSISQDEK